MPHPLASLIVFLVLACGIASSAAAQEASPAAEEGFEALFVQSVAGSTLVPLPESDGRFTLTLSGIPEQSVVFANRPDHFAGTVETRHIVDAVNAMAHDGEPANAALIGVLADGREEIVVVELLGAARNGEAVVYDVALLGADTELDVTLEAEPLANLAEGREYGVSSLFIDDFWDELNDFDCYTIVGAEMGTCGD